MMLTTPCCSVSSICVNTIGNRGAGLNHRMTRSRCLQKEERTQHEESKESETETVRLSPNQSSKENITQTARGRPKSKSKLPAITCGEMQWLIVQGNKSIPTYIMW